MRRTLTLLLPLAIILTLAVWRAQGPAPKPATAPADEFSALRASEVMGELLSENVPHPIGTAANRQVRERIESRFQALGYEISIQRRFACNWSATCGTVENLLARPPGSSDAKSVLLVAHYDSVPAGPGASDDAMGVAALLEVARAVAGKRFRNDVMFLITDGEEAGLLGAEAFVADEDLSRDVEVVINVENRGTHGASNLFETSRGNRWLIHHLAKGLERRQASSLFYEIYNLLPNDTDLTVFKRAGKAGVNFAAIRGVNWYHTPLDDVSHASLRTLQHHGENLLASLRALAQADLAARGSGNATYFDLLGFFVVWWPEQWTLWIAIVSLLLLLWGARPRRTRPENAQSSGERGPGTLQPMSFGVLAVFTTIALSAVTAFGVAWIARLGSRSINWVAFPQPGIAAMWLTGVAAALTGCAIVRRRAEPLAMLHGAAIVWHMIAIALAVTIPGAGFLFLVPAVAISLCALAGANATITSAIGTSAAAIFFFPLGLLLYEALGGGMLHVIAVLIAILATLAAPLFASYRIAAVVAIAMIVAAGTAALLPAWSSERPRFISLAWIDDSSAPSPWWLTPVTTEPLERAARFAPADPALTPWSRTRPWVAPAPPSPIERVALAGGREGDRVTLHVRSQRGAGRVVLACRGGSILTVNGVTPPPAPERRTRRVLNGWEFAVVQTGGTMTVEVAATGPISVVASDVTFGLPEGGSVLQDARDASVAVPVHDGDTTITRTRGSW